LRRWVAALFLVLIGFYLGAGSLDRCDETPMEQGQICHILCNDGCATAPVPTAPAAPLPDPLPKCSYTPSLDASALERHRQPEQAPPRA
jgi:hypothetical protein